MLFWLRLCTRLLAISGSISIPHPARPFSQLICTEADVRAGELHQRLEELLRGELREALQKPRVVDEPRGELAFWGYGVLKRGRAWTRGVCTRGVCMCSV